MDYPCSRHFSISASCFGICFFVISGFIIFISLFLKIIICFYSLTNEFQFIVCYFKAESIVKTENNSFKKMKIFHSSKQD